MDWDDLRVALALSRDGTLSGAAAALGVSHTTVGRRLRAMEERLGVRIFDATPEGYRLTPAGEDLVAVAARMETDVLSLEGRVVGRDVKLTGPLRVTTLEILFRAFVRELASFLARYPSVALTVVANDEATALTRREADVALRLTNAPPEHLVGRRLGHVEFALYASRALVARIGPDAPLDDYPWIHWDERLDMRWLDAILAEHAPRAKIALRVGVGPLAMRDAIAAGLGVQFLPRYDGDGDPNLQRIGPTFPGSRREVWLLTPKELARNPRVRAFMHHMEEQLRASPVLRA